MSNVSDVEIALGPTTPIIGKIEFNNSAKTVTNDPRLINVAAGKEIVSGSFEFDGSILDDAMKWRKYQNEPVNGTDDHSHWHSEDIPTEPGIYLAANLRKYEYQPHITDSELTEFIVQITGQQPFLVINLWQVGTRDAYTNVDPEYVRLHVNAGYTRIK